MTIVVNLPAMTLRIVALRRAEEKLRVRARLLELDPLQRGLANDLFRQASGLRRARMALIERCELN